MPKANKARQARIRRHLVVRKKIKGTAQRPRLNVFRSAQHIYAQVIDDTAGTTLICASTVEKEFNSKGGNKLAAREIGRLIAQRAKEIGISNVVFDRGGYLYHGRVKELADGAREGGLKF